jgi:hypothetical protein
VRRATQAALALALVDPDAARIVLEETDARSGLDATKEQDVREQRLMAWALVDLKRATFGGTGIVVGTRLTRNACGAVGHTSCEANVPLYATHYSWEMMP